MSSGLPISADLQSLTPDQRRRVLAIRRGFEIYNKTGDRHFLEELGVLPRSR